jgi:hypothetical protein
MRRPTGRFRRWPRGSAGSLKSLDSDGMFDPQTGLLTRDCFFRDLAKAIAEASDRSQPLSIARLTFVGARDERADLDRARLVIRVMGSRVVAAE